MPDDKFKLPVSSFDELVKVIKGYGHFTEAVGLQDVSNLVAINQTVISANAGFLVAAGILEIGAKKQPTLKGRALALALEHEMPAEMRQSWQKIVLESEFLSRLIAAVKIRKGMDVSTLQAHIAYSAGQPKRPQVMTGARTVVDILRAAEMLQESDGKLVANEAFASSSSATPSDNPTEGAQTSEPTDPLIEKTKIFRVDSPPTAFTTGGMLIQVNIELRIDCKPNELTGLGAKIRQIINEIGVKQNDQPAQGD